MGRADDGDGARDMVTVNATHRLRAATSEVQRAQIKKEIADMQLKIAKTKDSGGDTEALKRQLETLHKKLEYANRR